MEVNVTAENGACAALHNLWIARYALGLPTLDQPCLLTSRGR